MLLSGTGGVTGLGLGAQHLVQAQLYRLLTVDLGKVSPPAVCSPVNGVIRSLLGRCDEASESRKVAPEISLLRQPSSPGPLDWKAGPPSP